MCNSFLLTKDTACKSPCILLHINRMILNGSYKHRDLNLNFKLLNTIRVCPLFCFIFICLFFVLFCFALFGFVLLFFFFCSGRITILVTQDLFNMDHWYLPSMFDDIYMKYVFPYIFYQCDLFSQTLFSFCSVIWNLLKFRKQISGLRKRDNWWPKQTLVATSHFFL